MVLDRQREVAHGRFWVVFTDKGEEKAVGTGQRIKLFKVLLGKIPAVIFPPWWAVPVLAVITAIFGSTGNRQNRYIQKRMYWEQPKKYHHIALLPKTFHKITNCQELTEKYRHTAVPPNKDRHIAVPPKKHRHSAVPPKKYRQPWLSGRYSCLYFVHAFEVGLY